MCDTATRYDRGAVVIEKLRGVPGAAVKEVKFRFGQWSSICCPQCAKALESFIKMCAAPHAQILDTVEGAVDRDLGSGSALVQAPRSQTMANRIAHTARPLSRRFLVVFMLLCFFFGTFSDHSLKDQAAEHFMYFKII